MMDALEMNDRATGLVNKAAHERGRTPAVDEHLQPDMVLNAEYEYAIQTCVQAHEDRARVSSFYLVGVGSLVAAILGAQEPAFQDPLIYGAFALLFTVLGLYGVGTLLQLVRLREAWLESALAMNQIKEYYVRYGSEAHLAEAFRWRMTSIPAKYKPWSVSFMLASQVALLGGATFGAAMLSGGLAFGVTLWVPAIGVGLLTAALQMLVYRRLLTR